jgi:deoxyribodipyrimidine photo-lyase
MVIVDNRALSQDSKRAREVEVPLILLFVINPQDYVAYDCGPRRIDFVLRNLKSIKADANERVFAPLRSYPGSSHNVRSMSLNIPLYVTTHSPRRTLPTDVINILKRWNIKELYVNIEYEVDELRRDIKILELANQEDIKCTLVHDKLLVEPGTLFTQQARPFSVSALARTVNP